MQKVAYNVLLTYLEFQLIKLMF